MSLKRIIVVSGPTGSGKSEFAITLAEELNGEIVSADSVAVYRGFDIGSAKPDPESLERVPHHLISVLDPAEDFSAGRFVREADPVIEDIVQRGKVPIVTGGTGLYIKALLHGLISNDEQDAEEEKEEGGYELLQELDPQAAAELHPSDRARVRRAIRYFRMTGRSILDARADHQYGELRYTALVGILAPEREVLYERINQRTDRMLERGLVEETEQLLRGGARESRALGAIGYRHVMEFFQHGDRGQLREELARDTRRFAKRQLTWWRNEPGKLGWLPCQRPDFREFLESSGEFKQDAVYFTNQLK